MGRALLSDPLIRSLSFVSIRSHSDLISASGIGHRSALHQTLIEAQATHRAPSDDHRSPRPRNSSVPSCRLSQRVATSKRQLSPSSGEGQSAKRRNWVGTEADVQSSARAAGSVVPEVSSRSVPHEAGPPLWLFPIGSSYVSGSSASFRHAARNFFSLKFRERVITK